MTLAHLICRLFGHRPVDECYALKHSTRYVIVQRTYCERCAKELSHNVSTKLSRSQMLKTEWFIIKPSSSINH